MRDAVFVYAYARDMPLLMLPAAFFDARLRR